MQHTRRGLKANYLLTQNIRSLLAVRRVDDKALAMWCHHRPAWLSKILAGERGVKLKDLDRIADFFGLTVSQLFSYGISPLTERRRHERRKAQDRRGGTDRRQSLAERIKPEFDRAWHDSDTEAAVSDEGDVA